jgi:hypothetical protein
MTLCPGYNIVIMLDQRFLTGGLRGTAETFE